MSDTTYFLQQPNGAELTRLIEQASLIKEYVPLFPPSLDKSLMHTILDIGCGPGSWVLDVASLCPDAQVVGLDIDSRMVTYAEARAISQELHNVSFQAADAREQLPFFSEMYDLVHLQLATSWVKDEMWLPLFQEVRRVLRGGMYLMITEGMFPESTSPALNRLKQLLLAVMQRMNLGRCQGYPDLGVIASLGNLLHQAHFFAVTVEQVDIDFSFQKAGAHKRCFDDLLALFTQLREQIVREGLTTHTHYHQLLEQFTQEAWREDFLGMSKIFTFTART